MLKRWCDGGHHQPAANDETTTALVEVSPGTVLLFGDVPEGLEPPIPFSLVSPADRAALSDAVTRSTGVLHTGAQVAPALAKAQGVVQLAPETLAPLRAGATPIQSGGYNIGTLAVNGKFAASVRWLPATGATAAVAYRELVAQSIFTPHSDFVDPLA